MSARPTARPYEKLSRQWRELAERRRAHFIDLYRTGRWKHYYTEQEFVVRIREVFSAAETWARLAPAASEGGERPG
jgi:uncharacterized repeat protein (TIGR03809 family)